MSSLNPTPTDAATARARARAFRQAFLRSFSVQGSWNYRTMVGGGFAFAILPILRRVFRDDPEGLAEAVRRHSEHFNAHPYLVGMAVGAVGRMEKGGEDPQRIDRFKLALRGALGSLGDRIIWWGWLPLSGLVGLIVSLLSPLWWTGPTAFLLTYNAGHLTLRTWAFRAGVREGKDIGSLVRTSKIGRSADRLGLPVALLAGVLVGLLLGKGIELGSVPWPLLPPVAVLFALGVRAGEPARKWGTFVFILFIMGISLVGALG